MAYSTRLHSLIKSLTKKEKLEIEKLLDDKAAPKTLLQFFILYKENKLPSDIKVTSLNKNWSNYHTALKDFVIEYLYKKEKCIEHQITAYIVKALALYNRKTMTMLIQNLKKGKNWQRNTNSMNY